MKVLPIGSFDVFINIPAAYVSLLPEPEKENIAESIHAEFRKRLSKYQFNVQIHSLATYRHGCLITTVIISIVIPASILAIGKGAYTFIKDYDKLKSNIKLIKEDFKNVFLKRNNKKKAEPTKAEGTGSDQKNTDYEIVNHLPAEFQKAYEAGKEIYLEKTTTCYKICIMRDDIKEKITEADIKDNIVKVPDVKKLK